MYIDRIFKSGDSAEGHLLMGIAHLNRFDYPSAKTELERALQLNSRLPTANSAPTAAPCSGSVTRPRPNGVPSGAVSQHQRLRSRT